MKINPHKIKALNFTRARVKDPLNYSLEDQKIPEASFFTDIWESSNEVIEAGLIG